MLNTLLSFLFFHLITSTKGQIYDAVVCSESTVAQTIACGGQGIIEIESVTIAVVHNRSECSYSLTSVVEQLDNRCRRTDVKPRDGKEVFRRCFGDESCTFDGSVVDKEFFGWFCDPEYRNPYANVFWFKYSCHLVDPHSPSMALLPLPENREVEGSEVDIFSPYYPCFTPVPVVTDEHLLVVDCSITPQRTFSGSFVTFTVLPKHVEILQNPRYCQDYLYFDGGLQSSRLFRNYCGETIANLEVWNDKPITIMFALDLHIKYRVQNAGAGAKFWFRVTAVENRKSVNVSITCSEQENIPPLASEQTCIPLVDRSVSTTLTTEAPASSSALPAEESTVGGSFTDDTNDEENERQQQGEGGSGGVVGGMVGLSVVIVVIAVVAIVLGIKLRKSQLDKREGQPTTAANQPANPTANPDVYETIPDHMVTAETGRGHPSPVMCTTPITTATDNDAYEEVESGARRTQPKSTVRPDMPDVTENTPTQQYEDVRDNPQYEPLKVAEVENTKPKVYASLSSN